MVSQHQAGLYAQIGEKGIKLSVANVSALPSPGRCTQMQKFYC